MRAILRFVRTTVVGGILFLVPVSILVYFLGEAFGFVSKLIEPLIRYVPAWTVAGVALATVITIGALIGICFVAGLFARMAVARGLMRGVEEKILDRIPGYAMMRSMAHGWIGHQQSGDLSTALLRLDDAWHLAIVVDRCADGRSVVFVPEAPEAMSGAIFIVDADRVQPLNVPISDALRCVKRFGAGAPAFLKQP